jgi:hypothetical protein
MIQPTLEVLDRLVGYPTVSTDSNLELIDYAGRGADHPNVRRRRQQGEPLRQHRA